MPADGVLSPVISDKVRLVSRSNNDVLKISPCQSRTAHAQHLHTCICKQTIKCTVFSDTVHSTLSTVHQLVGKWGT